MSSINRGFIKLTTEQRDKFDSVLNEDDQIYNLTTKKIEIKKVGQWVEEIGASLGRFRGNHDPSSGALPSETTFPNIIAGDYWYISQQGNLVNIGSGDPIFRVGDVLMYRGSNNPTLNDPTNQEQYFGLQGNLETSADIAIAPGFTPAAGTITSGDSVQLAIEKLQGNIANASVPFLRREEVVLNAGLDTTVQTIFGESIGAEYRIKSFASLVGGNMMFDPILGLNGYLFGDTTGVFGTPDRFNIDFNAGTIRIQNLTAVSLTVVIIRET